MVNLIPWRDQGVARVVVGWSNLDSIEGLMS